jgi:C4-type Zn-finger protein
MIKVLCDYCGKELKDLGALLFSPPNKDIVQKFHICRNCYYNIKPKEKEEIE